MLMTRAHPRTDVADLRRLATRVPAFVLSMCAEAPQFATSEDELSILASLDVRSVVREGCPRGRRCYASPVARRVTIWTWDKGSRPVDMDGPPELLVPILETVLTGALWRELEKFPTDTLARLLPQVTVPRNIRRLVEIWIEERSPAATRAPSVARPRAQGRRRQQPRL
jgi:hypothetical protein